LLKNCDEPVKLPSNATMQMLSVRYLIVCY
jgi:hypothetical protein